MSMQVVGCNPFSTSSYSPFSYAGNSGSSSVPGFDDFDIDGGNQSRYRVSNDNDDGTDGRNNSGINDQMALMEFIGMLVAIMAQLFQGGGQSGNSSPSTPARGTYAYSGNDNNGNSGNQYLPPSQPVRQYDASDISDTSSSNTNNANSSSTDSGTRSSDTTASTSSSSSSSTYTGTGVAPNSSQVVQTGTGTGQYYNVTNNTDRAQTFAFTSGSSNTSGYSGNTNALMTLQPGETGTFESGANVPGIRINTSGANGETNGNEALYEDTVETNPMGSGIVHNPDVSDVAGNLSYDGKAQKITVNDGTRTIGDGTTTGVYDYATEDTDTNSATNPMNMALDPSNTYNIVFSDG